MSELPVQGKHLLLNSRRFYVHSQIYHGPFSDVFLVLEGGQRYAIKVERSVGACRRELKIDVLVLTQMSKSAGAEGFPRLITAGRSHSFRFAVMQLVGPDLARLRRALPHKRLSLSSALRISIETLHRLESLHDCGWLCRDVKANNYAVGRGKKANQIYMIDFGFATPFIDKRHTEQEWCSELVGTMLYAPLAAHHLSEQCRRDDVESWFYMTVESIAGSLPWSELDPKAEFMLIGECKRFARFSGRWQLLKECPKELDTILDLIDNTGFHTRPDYRLIQVHLENAMHRFNIDRDAPFEWEKDRLLLRRATVMGDRGESNFASSKLRRLEAAAALDDDGSAVDTSL